MNNRKVLVLVSGLVLCAGCAIEDRWTLDSKPHRTHQTSTTRSANGKSTAQVDSRASQRLAAAKDLVLLQKDCSYCLHNNNTKQNILATVRITSTDAGGRPQGSRDILVLVLAGSSMKLGDATDPRTGDQWSYTLATAEYQ